MGGQSFRKSVFDLCPEGATGLSLGVGTCSSEAALHGADRIGLASKAALHGVGTVRLRPLSAPSPIGRDRRSRRWFAIQRAERILSAPGQAIWAFMVMRGRDFLPQIEVD